MIWDENPFDEGHWVKLGVNLDYMLEGDGIWEAMRLKIAVVNKRAEIVQSDNIRNDHFLLMRRRKRQAEYDRTRRKRVAKEKITKQCELDSCKSMFTAYRVDQRCCSRHCYAKLYKKINPDKRQNSKRRKKEKDNGHLVAD